MSAELIAYDAFEYGASNEFVGQEGEIGFDTEWSRRPDGEDGYFAFVEGSLSFDGLRTQGNRLSAIPVLRSEFAGIDRYLTDQDLDFDQLDLVKVQIAAKYLTAQAATWGDGDWNGAPGGFSGNPPEGDRLFNQLDIVAALSAGKYLSGPYASSRPGVEAAHIPTMVEYGSADRQAEWVYVPEPNSIGLLSMGLIALIGVRRRMSCRANRLSSWRSARI